ncbi:global transactivator [Fusarium flagelliforme]|uniref:Global transactivator n=1 Tax=Fusarium flagelliforme TaxID=2675880 RepID=A0A395MPR3_9HYPO|nr:global transactivator [Fusarium flagelliforme]
MSGNIKDQECVDALAEKLNALLVIAIEAESPKPPEQRLVWDKVLSDGNLDSRSWVVPPRRSNAIAETSQDDKGDRASEAFGSEFTDSDDDSEYQDVLDSQFDEDEFHDYLKALHTRIVAKPRTQPDGDIPSLRPGITLQEHQISAVGKAELAMNSQLKGMILVDPLVTPLSCCQQWMKEIKKFFNDDSMSAFRLARDRANVDDIFRYKIIVTSYRQVSAELGRLRQSPKRIWAYHKGRLP